MTNAAHPRHTNELPVQYVPPEGLLRLGMKPFHVAAEPQLSAHPMGLPAQFREVSVIGGRQIGDRFLQGITYRAQRITRFLIPVFW